MTAITRNTLYKKKLFCWQIFMLFLKLYLQQIQEAYLVLSPWTCKEHIFEKSLSTFKNFSSSYFYIYFIWEHQMNSRIIAFPFDFLFNDFSSEDPTSVFNDWQHKSTPKYWRQYRTWSQWKRLIESMLMKNFAWVHTHK